MPGDEKPRHFDAFVDPHAARRAARPLRVVHGAPAALALVPDRRRNSRVFQAMSVKDIVAKVLGDYKAGSDHEFRLNDTPPKLDYCVQYDETDFDFVTRLLEEAGICYFFEHTDSKHTMVMADAMSKHKVMTGTGKIKWSNALRDEATVINWFGQKESRPKKAVGARLRLPRLGHQDRAGEVRREAPEERHGRDGDLRVPGRVVQNQAKPDKYANRRRHGARAGARDGAAVVDAGLYTGTTNSREVTVGATFELEDPDGGLLGAALGALFGGGTDKQRVVYVTERKTPQKKKKKKRTNAIAVGECIV